MNRNIFKIDPKKIVPTIQAILQENRNDLINILEQKNYTWNNVMQPMEEMEYRLSWHWSIVSHLNAVMNTPELRTAYQQCLPLISEYSSEISQNVDLWKAVKSLTNNKELNSVQQKIIHEELVTFKLAGIELESTAKDQLAKLKLQLSKLMNYFEENLLDATQNWSHLVKDPDELKGIPEHAVQFAEELAKKKYHKGWLFTLDAPAYDAVMTFADSRNLRQQMYYGYTTRASDVGPLAGHYDNYQVMENILLIRKQIAHLLGYANFAELSLERKTAKTTAEVLKFLNDLVEYTLPIAQQEFAELANFAKEKYQINTLQAWDIGYISEKLREAKLAFSEEELRMYFLEENVLQGMFDIVNRLFNIHVKENFDVKTWHKDVRVFDVFDKQNQFLGQFFADLYARENKRGGAWMDVLRARRRLQNGELHTPIAFLTCNFTPPIKSKPSLFSFDEVQTLFHEFGHTLNELVSQIDYPEAAGTAAIPWDVVEFPSQFLENWCWEKPALDLFAKHYQTGNILPENLFKKLRAARSYQAGLATLRQLELALFDFILHMEFDPAIANQIQAVLDKVRSKTALYPIPKYNRFQNSFAHIFGSSYAAGYYSYKWAEVWSSDAFAEFEEQGIFNSDVGEKFLNSILAKGSSEDPLQMFIAFRGREPKIDALLKHMQPHPVV